MVEDVKGEQQVRATEALSFVEMAESAAALDRQFSQDVEATMREIATAFQPIADRVNELRFLLGPAVPGRWHHVRSCQRRTTPNPFRPHRPGMAPTTHPPRR